MKAAAHRSPYIVGRSYDWAFFLAPPALALLAGFFIEGTDFAQREGPTGAGFFIGALIHAHLVAVFFRSHGNRSVFRLHPVRFVVVPIALFVAIVGSAWIGVAAMVVATFWDVWHSGAQTFGFARIYDRNGGHRAPGRRLDFWLNQLLYAGPILAGATLMDHVLVLEEFELFEDPLSNFLVVAPVDVQVRSAWLSWTVIVGGVAFVAYYLFAQWRLWRRGERPNPLKVWLLASTGLCSILTWGFNPWGEAFFIMNLFHAVQYLALVWAVEHRSMRSWMRLDGVRLGKPLTAGVYLGSVAAYGCAVELLDPGLHALWAATMVVSLMHFWYDAFIWSVRKRQI